MLCIVNGMVGGSGGFAAALCDGVEYVGLGYFFGGLVRHDGGEWGSCLGLESGIR